MQRSSRTVLPRGRRGFRGLWARVVTTVMVLSLGFALLKLQVMDMRNYALVAKENRLRPLQIPVPRGTIYDRHGEVIAENIVGYQILLMPAKRDSLARQLERLKPVLGLTDQDIEFSFRKWTREQSLPMVVKADASPVAVARLEERRFLFPNVLVHEYPKRHYPSGKAVAHFIGYVAEISERELTLPDFAGYRQGRQIGKNGLERQYERELGGEPGMRYLEVDARGRIKRWLPEELGDPPIAGRDLQLHLDLDLQRYVEKIFPTKMAGGFVALDPSNGGVLAYYSNPSYDPNLFVGGIPSNVWDALQADSMIPLLNRASGSNQPPGSVWKLPFSAMALREGVITAEQRFPIPCTGGMAYQGRYARCHLPSGHGFNNMIEAIKNSCDVYFYQLGIRFGLKKFLETGTRYGWNRKTGIDLPGELTPLFPRSYERYADQQGYKPADNHVMSFSIGQAANAQTELKMATIYQAWARSDGKSPRPRIVQSAEPIEFSEDYGVTPEQIDVLRKGMRRVVAPGGTAPLSRLPYWDFMGKTGTAQNSQGLDHGLFTGMTAFPGRNPEIVAAMMLEFGEHGATASGYVANAMNFYMNRKYGRPFDRFPTPRDKYPRGLPVDEREYQKPLIDYPVPPPAGARSASAPATPPAGNAPAARPVARR
jgi:penicillin-binding protein 2